MCCASRVFVCVCACACSYVLLLLLCGSCARLLFFFHTVLVRSIVGFRCWYLARVFFRWCVRRRNCRRHVTAGVLFGFGDVVVVAVRSSLLSFCDLHSNDGTNGPADRCNVNGIMCLYVWHGGTEGALPKVCARVCVLLYYPLMLSIFDIGKAMLVWSKKK